MEETTDRESILNALRALTINSLINAYAAERVAFGFEKAGDTAPIDLYLKDLRLRSVCVNKRSDFCGIYIDEHEHIRTEQDRDEIVRDIFISQAEIIFECEPKNAKSERDGVELPLSSRFREYVLGLLPLFTEVLDVDVKYDAFDIIPTDLEVHVREYPEWRRFVTAILLKPLRAGRQIDRYVGNFTSAPYYVRQLIEKRGNGYYLKPVDINSCEYIFALFSLIQFMNAENNKLFELKMREWERRHKCE